MLGNATFYPRPGVKSRRGKMTGGKKSQGKRTGVKIRGVKSRIPHILDSRIVRNLQTLLMWRGTLLGRINLRNNKLLMTHCSTGEQISVTISLI